MRVHLLTVGEYEENHVIGVFSDKHLAHAKRIADMMDGWVDDESFVVDIYSIEEPPPGTESFLVTMFHDGTFKCMVRPSLTEEGKRHAEQYRLETHAKEPDIFERKSHWRLYVECYAKTPGHAEGRTLALNKMIGRGEMPTDGLQWRDLVTGVESGASHDETQWQDVP